MRITVKFFASLQEQLGQAELELELEAQSISVADVWAQVNQNSSYPDNILSAVNLEYAKGEDQLKDGDEVAFFPPVTGG